MVEVNVLSDDYFYYVREAEVECVLWDECSEEAYSAYLKTKDPPVVVVLSFARIGFSEDGLCYLRFLFTE